MNYTTLCQFAKMLKIALRDYFLSNRMPKIVCRASIFGGWGTEGIDNVG